MANKLTKVQKRVLSYMVEHDTTIMTVHGRGGSSAFFSKRLGKPGGHNVRISTVFALKTKGMVRSIGDPDSYWRGGKYEITDAGRAAVEGNAEHKMKGD